MSIVKQELVGQYRLGYEEACWLFTLPTSWRPSEYQGLVWNVEQQAWEYDGHYAGCDECRRGLWTGLDGKEYYIPKIGGWIEVDIEIDQAQRAADYGMSYNFFGGIEGASGWYMPIPAELRSAGLHTYRINMQEAWTTYLYWNGVAMMAIRDRTQFGFYLGYKEGEGDRSWRIRDIRFSLGTICHILG
jgi:hypothetical protein